MDIGLETLQLNCPMCNKHRSFTSKTGFYKAKRYKTLCNSCSNSIAGGGNGLLIKDNTKICSSCKQFKNFDEFSIQIGNGKMFSRCKICQSVYNSNYGREVFRFDRYNTSKERFEELLILQDNKCAICNCEITTKCHIDHCHESNKVRGLLCSLCNKGLGQFKDNIEYLTNAIKYLKSHE